MTVIAWDGKTLAADKRAGTDMPRTVTKIRRTASGALVGCTGTACGDAELMDWFEAGADRAKFPARHLDIEKSSHMIVIEPGGRILMYCDSSTPYLCEDNFHAIGSGRDFAMAAMHLGLSAREAVDVACRLSATCGNGIDTLELAP